MLKLVKNTLIYSTLGLLLTSCAASHIGTMSGNASISNPNFTIKETALGAAKSRRYFGFGGLHNNGLVYAAKEDLLANNPLQPGEALANITVDFRYTYYLFWTTTLVVLHADVVDFNTDSTQQTPVINNKVMTYRGYNLNERVSVLTRYEKAYHTIIHLGAEKVTLRSDEGNVVKMRYSKLPSRSI